jgi:fibrillarin-like pre-rRNA processing protein
MKNNMRDKFTWDPFKSKWKAALERGMDIELKGDENILYLGASSGSTVGHLCEITTGIIYAVEKSYQMAIPLVKLCEKRVNIAPIFTDAHDTDYLKDKIKDEKIDILFCDIPSGDQVDILIKASKLVNKECKILFSLKTQSISQDDPKVTLKEVEKKLGKVFKIIDVRNMEPYHKKHWFFILENK